MTNLKKLKMRSIMMLLLGISFTACVTDDYDLNKGLNTDIAVGGDSLSLPIGQTDTIMLKKLLGDSIKVLTAKDGEYALNIKDSLKVKMDAVQPVSFSIAGITIPPISQSFASVQFPTFQFNQIAISSDLPLKDLTITTKTVSSIHTNFDIANSLTIPINPGPISFSTGNLTYSSGVKHITQNMDLIGLPSVLNSINEIQFTNSKVTLTFDKSKINSIGFDSQTDKISIFNITFPSNITLSSPIGTGSAISSDGHSFTITDAALNANNGIYIASFIIQKLVPPPFDVNHELHYSGDVTYSIDYTFSGTINDISKKNYTYPKTLDLAVTVKLDADPVIDNMIISTNPYAVDVAGSNAVNKDVTGIPSAISQVTSLTFNTGAELSLNIADPGVSPFQFSSGNCVIQLPQTIVFKPFGGLDLITNKLTIPYSSLFGTKIIGISGINLNKTVTNQKITIIDNLTYQTNSLTLGSATADLYTLQGITGKKLNITANITGLSILDAAIQTNSISLDIPAQNSNIDISQFVSADVKKIYKVGLKTPAQLKFKILINNLPSSIDSIFLDNYTIKLPSVLSFNSIGQINGKTVANIKNAQNEVIINRGFKVSDGLQFTLSLENFDFGTNGNTLTDGKFNLHESVSMSGGAHIKGANLKSSDLQPVEIVPTIQIDPMSLSVIEGLISPVIDPIAKNIPLDFPDLLKNKDNNLALKPVLTFEVGNSMGIPIDLSLNLTPKSKGVAIPNSNITTSLHITETSSPGQTTWSKFRLAASATGLFDDHKEVIIPNLDSLLKTIPDEIAINATPTIDVSKHHIVDLYSTKNQIDLNYAVNVPLKFGQNFKFNLNETIPDLQKGLKDITKFVHNINIIANIENKIPMDIAFKMLPYNSSNQLIDSTKLKVTAQAIKYSESTSLINVGSTIFGLTEVTPGSLAELDKFIITITASKNVITALLPLKPDQYFLIKLRVVIPKGITVDLNSSKSNVKSTK
ncbi:MAG: hypothetical protein WCK78_12725 [Paludibacter sp.]